MDEVKATTQLPPLFTHEYTVVSPTSRRVEEVERHELYVLRAPGDSPGTGGQISNDDCRVIAVCSEWRMLSSDLRALPGRRVCRPLSRGYRAAAVGPCGYLWLVAECLLLAGPLKSQVAAPASSSCALSNLSSMTVSWRDALSHLTATIVWTPFRYSNFCQLYRFLINTGTILEIDSLKIEGRCNVLVQPRRLV